MLEIENAVVVVAPIFIKYNGLCGGLADSNYFYTEEPIPCINFCVCEMPFACMLCAQLQPCMQFVKACIVDIIQIKSDRQF